MVCHLHQLMHMLVDAHYECCRLAKPNLPPDLALTHADRCCRLAQPYLPLTLVLVLTSDNYSLAGECPLFPWQACSYPHILHLLWDSVVQPDLNGLHLFCVPVGMTAELSLTHPRPALPQSPSSPAHQ